MKKILTALDIARTLGQTVSTVSRALEDTEPAVVLGRSEGYALEDVQDVYWERHKALLVFLGLPETRTASYDVLTASEEG